MKGIAKLISAVLLTILLLGVAGPILGHAQGPEGEPTGGPVLEGVPAPPTDLELEKLAEEFLRDGSLPLSLEDVDLSESTSPSYSPEQSYVFALGTATLSVNKPRGAIYHAGEPIQIQITTSVPGYFILFDWQPAGTRQWFNLGYVPAHQVARWSATIAPPYGLEVLIAVNWLNGDYGWTYFFVVP